MESIFTYSDYRKYVRDAIAEKQQRNRSFSCRSAAESLGVGSGTLSRIINGSRHIGPELLPKMIDFLGLKRREAAYFTLLVSFEQMKGEDERRRCYIEMIRLRTRCSSIVAREKYRFFEKWYHVALFELTRIVKDVSDPSALGALFMPPLSESKTRKAIELLREIGYVKKGADDDGERTVEPFLTTGEAWESVAIHSFQVAMSNLATEALDNLPKEERDFSTLTMALSKDSFDKIRDVLKSTRAQIAQIERECKDPERVYQINFQCFPLTIPYGKKGGD